MNGLLGWILEHIGFDVMRMSGGVRRVERGDSAFGNHLVLCVLLEEPWIVDVGLGEGPYEPYPLRSHSFTQDGFSYRLERLEDCWRLHNYPGSTAPSFDFRKEPADEFVQSIYGRFDVAEPALETLWEKVLEQHELYLASKDKFKATSHQ